MELIIGGVYQGKLDYAVSNFGITDEDVFRCDGDAEPDFSKRCIYGFEKYLHACLRAGTAPELEKLRDDAVVICQDISCGIVPVDFLERQWRELCGRTLTTLAAQAETVTRIFCGLPQQLKP